MPSKTFHFGLVNEEVLGTLFEHHLVLAALLEASTSIPGGGPLLREAALAQIADLDKLWIRLFRQPDDRASQTTQQQGEALQAYSQV